MVNTASLAQVKTTTLAEIMHWIYEWTGNGPMKIELRNGKDGVIGTQDAIVAGARFDTYVDGRRVMAFIEKVVEHVDYGNIAIGEIYIPQG